mmetsp:Transcript_19774/g.32436  ORF Transcript_19774/g.32436 Transcript_19774/m.32436 type:complete len:572 (+) Transcript_19774:73-1788(+)
MSEEEVDNQGRCAKHPFVQIKRRSRQGEWKALLDSCPLCAIDRGHTEEEDCCNSSISSGNSISEKEEHTSVALIPADDDVSARRTSKVKFASDDESPIIPLPASLLPPLEMSEHGCGQSVASNTGSIVSARSALKESKYKVCQKKMQQHLNETENVTTMSMDLDIDEDSEDEEEQLAVTQPPQPQPEPQPEIRPQPQPVEEELIHRESRRKDHGERDRDNRRKEKRRSKRHQIRSSLVQVSPNTMNRPDPEEFPCGESLGSNHQEMPRPLRSPSYSSGPYTNVVVCPPTNFDDEVSAISFMESVKYQPVPNSRQHHQDPIAEETENIQDTAECINTNNYDKKGRCVNHPQIRLRKKKLFGRGWKVLMNACPDCCVDELRRFKSVEASKRRQPRSSLLEYQGGGSFRSAPLLHRDNSVKSITDETASLTASNSSGSSDRSPKNFRQERVDMHETAPAEEAKEKEVIFVRQMQWADERCNSGLYTGEVDSGFAPHGSGSLQYNDGLVVEGKWRHGEYRPKRRSRSSSRSRSSRSRSQSKTRVSSSGRSRSSSRSSVTRTRSRSVSVQPVASYR